MSSDFRVSVVILAYRRQQHILDAVRSVLDSDVERTSYEILLVTDAVSGDLENRLAEQGVRIILSDVPAVGDSMATGVTSSRGEIVAFLDDDDRFHPGKLRSILELFSDPDVVFYHHAYRRVTAEGQPMANPGEQARVLARLSLPVSRAGFGRMRRWGAFYNSSAIVVRRAALIPHVSILRPVTNANDFAVFLALTGPGDAVVDGIHVLSDYRTHGSLGTHRFDADSLPPEHLKFLEGTVRSFEWLQGAAPTEAARRFAESRADSYETLLWATTRTTVSTARRSIRFRAIRAVAENLGERDLRNAAVLGLLTSLSVLSRRWALRFYVRLKRAELSSLGLDSSSPSPPAEPST